MSYKPTALTAFSGDLASGDLAHFVDVSDTTMDPGGTSKKATRSQIIGSNLLTWEGKTAPSSSVVGTSDSQTLTNKTIDGDNNTISDISITSIKSSSLAGLDNKILTGTVGTSGNIPMWNADGDLVDGSQVAANLVEVGDISNSRLDTIGITIGNGVDVITTGYKACTYIPYNATIEGWTIIENSDVPVTGSIVVEVHKDSYANYPPTDADVISGSEHPTLSSSNKNQDNSLSTWTTSISADDLIRFEVTSVTDCKRVTLFLKVRKTL